MGTNKVIYDIRGSHSGKDVNTGHINLWADTKVSEEQTASIFRASAGSMFLQNVISLQVHKALKSRSQILALNDISVQ
jgi:hypothetical protein